MVTSTYITHVLETVAWRLSGSNKVPAHTIDHTLLPITVTVNCLHA